MSVYVLPAFLTPEECAHVRDVGERMPLSSVAINVDEKNATLGDKRRRGRAGFTAIGGEIEEKVKSLIAEVNKRFFDFAISDVEPFQFAEYRQDDHYDWHLDIGPGPASLRKLSVSIQVSPSDRYEGGSLEVWGSKEPADRELGTAVIFPSYLLHRVTPVTRGIRYSLVAWAIGSRPFR